MGCEPPLRRPYSARPSSLLSQPALFSVSLLLCQRLVGQFALRTFKRAQIGTSKAGLGTDQHHANLALGAASPLDHAKGMRFWHVMHSLCFRRERNTLSHRRFPMRTITALVWWCTSRSHTPVPTPLPFDDGLVELTRL